MTDIQTLPTIDVERVNLILLNPELAKTQAERSAVIMFLGNKANELAAAGEFLKAAEIQQSQFRLGKEFNKAQVEEKANVRIPYMNEIQKAIHNIQAYFRGEPNEHDEVRTVYNEDGTVKETGAFPYPFKVEFWVGGNGDLVDPKWLDQHSEKAPRKRPTGTRSGVAKKDGVEVGKYASRSAAAKALVGADSLKGTVTKEDGTVKEYTKNPTTVLSNAGYTWEADAA